MYVLVIENKNRTNSGYLVIHDKREYIETEQGYNFFSDGEDYYIESPDESNYFIELDSKRVNLYPFGSIIVQWHNRQVDEYLNRGGKIEPLMEKSSKIHFEPPYRPNWIFNLSTKSDVSKETLFNALSEFEPQEVNYIKTAIVELGEQRYTLFNVDDLLDLRHYDFDKIHPLQIPIDVCKYCGHAFVKTSRDVMCDKCRKEKKGEAEKQRRWNESEINREYAKFTNALRKRNGVGTASAYYEWITQKREAGTVTVEWLKQWRQIDNGFKKLCRYFSEPEGKTSSLCQQWETERNKFPHEITDPEQWVNEWLEKIKE